MLHLNVKKLVHGIKEIASAEQEEPEMFLFFVAMARGELGLSSFKVKTLEKILDTYYEGKGHVFEKKLRSFARVDQVDLLSVMATKMAPRAHRKRNRSTRFFLSALIHRGHIN